MPAWRGWSRGLKGIEEACQIVFRIIKMNRCPQVSVLFADHDVPGPELSLLFARMTTDIETNDTGPFCPRTRCADLKLAALGFLHERRGQQLDPGLDIGEADLGDIVRRPLLNPAAQEIGIAILEAVTVVGEFRFGAWP